MLMGIGCPYVYLQDFNKLMEGVANNNNNNNNNNNHHHPHPPLIVALSFWHG
jgi:hypothetical protein